VDAEFAQDLKDFGRLLLAMEVHGADTYWHVYDDSQIYGDAFPYPVVGILWDHAVEHQTWFGGGSYVVSGIQLLPFTPGMEDYLKKDWVAIDLPVYRKECTENPECNNGWSWAMCLEAAVLDSKDGYRCVKALPKDAFHSGNAAANGNSLTNSLHWIATRPGASFTPSDLLPGSPSSQPTYAPKPTHSPKPKPKPPKESESNILPTAWPDFEAEEIAEELKEDGPNGPAWPDAPGAEGIEQPEEPVESEVETATSTTTSAKMMSMTTSAMSSTTTSAMSSTTTSAMSSTTTSATGDESIQSGDVIYLKTHTGHLIDVEETDVQDRWYDHGEWQKLVIEKSQKGPGPIRSGDAIYLMTHSRKYIDVQGQRVGAYWHDRGRWQVLHIEKPGGGTIESGDDIFLRAHTGNYLDAEHDIVRARWNQHGDWQRLTVERCTRDATAHGEHGDRAELSVLKKFQAVRAAGGGSGWPAAIGGLLVVASVGAVAVSLTTAMRRRVPLLQAHERRNLIVPAEQASLARGLPGLLIDHC